jgi:bifunctional non-homologous end joining protein LigD
MSGGRLGIEGPGDGGQVVLTPPVEVMRPVAGPVPGWLGPAGAWQFSAKLDGWRCCAFVLTDSQVRLQARSGRDITAAFPEVMEALGRLPVGTAVDGELCAWQEGKFVFEQLARSPAARRRAGVSVSFVAFDALSMAGRDLRQQPLTERWEALTEAVERAGSPLETVLATNDRAEAIAWMQILAPLGVEGLVARRWDSRYRPRSRADAWWKHRFADTVDAVVVGLFGSPRRPDAVLLELADGSTVASAPLPQRLSAQLADPTALAADGRLHRVVDGPLVELRMGMGRHGKVVVVRVRDR